MLWSGCCIVCCLLCAMERNRGVFWSDIARTDAIGANRRRRRLTALSAGSRHCPSAPSAVLENPRTDGRTEERMRSEYTSAAAAALGGRGRNGQRKRGSPGRGAATAGRGMGGQHEDDLKD